MGAQDIIALLVVAVAVVYAGRSLWRMLHGETGCGGGCGCSHRAAAPSRDTEAGPATGKSAGVRLQPSPEHQAGPRTLKHIPLVPVDQIGRPAPK